MIDTVKRLFREKMLTQVQWMTENTRKAAVRKVNDVAKRVAYSEWITNDRHLNAHYANLTLGADFFMSLESTFPFLTHEYFGKLTEKVHRERELVMAPATVNAGYNPFLNSIMFPAGILNAPFFDPNFPRSVNYGAIGFVMGHELLHGFGNNGVQFDGTGYLDTWIDQESMKGFTNMTECVIRQYDKYCYLPAMDLDPSCVNGQLTQGENIADSGGLKAAWIAFKEAEKKHGVQQPLPGTLMEKFTQDQLFFLSFAHIWCGDVPKSAKQEQLLDGVHSPGRFRVEGAIANVADEFAKVFNCPAGSKMTPKDHCHVWAK